VYDSELNGQDVAFGTSGFLYQNNKLMYDRTTRSLWHSLTGEPVVGELANSGIELTKHPVTVTTWGEWLEQHPETTAVDINTGFNRRYLDPSESGSAYFEYRASPEAMFPTFSVDGRLPEKSNVIGVAFDGESLAIPVGTILSERVVNTFVGFKNIVLVGHPTTGVIGAYDGDWVRFSAGSAARSLVDETGAEWSVGDDSLVAEDSRVLKRIPAHELFWFAWIAFFPGTEIYEGI